MNKTVIGLIASLIFALMMGAGFFWLWTTSQKDVSTASSAAGNYQAVEVESVKKEATTILGLLEKNSDIPLTTPTEKMGRTNPFVAP
jgi:hypothetical protein